MINIILKRIIIAIMRNWIIAILVSIVGTFLVGFSHVGLHQDNMLSTYNSWSEDHPPQKVNNRYLQEAYDYHKNEATFKRRPVTTFLITFLQRKTSLQIGESFIVVNFFALFLCGLFLFLLSKELKLSNLEAILSVLIFFTAYSTLFAFYMTNYTYDEPLQYLFLLSGFYYMRRNNIFLFAILFFLALLTRETSSFFLAFYFLFYYKKKNWVWVSALLVILIYTGIQLIFYESPNLLQEQEVRLSYFDFNFHTLVKGLESIVSWCMVTFLAIVLSINAKKEFEWQKSFFILFIFNSFMVMFFAFARESRLFALPLLLFWPFAGKLLLTSFRDFAKAYPGLKKALGLILFLLMGGLLIKLYQYLDVHYDTSITPLDHTINAQYLTVFIPVIFVLIYMKISTLWVNYLSR